MLKYTFTSVIPVAHPNTKHGYYGTNIYRVWIRMNTRCNNPNSPVYHHYGGRGIKVCKRWASFENWLDDMGERPTPQHTLERIDNNKGYNPKNCRWATRKEQAQNRRTTRIYTLNGKTQTLSDWAKELGIAHESLRKRLKKWSVEDALTRKKMI